MKFWFYKLLLVFMSCNSLFCVIKKIENFTSITYEDSYTGLSAICYKLPDKRIIHASLSKKDDNGNLITAGVDDAWEAEQIYKLLAEEYRKQTNT